MEVLKYLNNLCEQGSSSYTALGMLEEEYGIKFNIWEDLVCLNYCQISSPKYNPITKECRSLVLGITGKDECEDFYIVSRSFDRFFNEGEEPEQEYDISELVAHEKIDGSLIGVFHHNGRWLYRTRSMIMPTEDMKINGSNPSWKELIESQIKPCSHYMKETCTYIFEIVSPENRVVTRYQERNAYLLQIRSNCEFGNYSFNEYLFDVACMGGWLRPKSYKFDTMLNCIEASKELRNLEEGYVLYDNKGVPQIKVKNPAYVAAHHLRGEGQLSSKRVMDLIFMNEQDEYLSIFSEDTHRFEPYIEALNRTKKVFDQNVEDFIEIQDQKSFALTIKGSGVAGLLFMKRKNKELTFEDCFNKLTTPAKYRLVESYL